jgi:hypothetical protein
LSGEELSKNIKVIAAFFERLRIDRTGLRRYNSTVLSSGHSDAQQAGHR